MSASPGAAGQQVDRDGEGQNARRHGYCAYALRGGLDASVAAGLPTDPKSAEQGRNELGEIEQALADSKFGQGIKPILRMPHEPTQWKGDDLTKRQNADVVRLQLKGETRMHGVTGVTMATRTIPGLDAARQSKLVVELNRNLAGLTDLAAAYKQAHWNVIGIDFAQLHELFDQFADQTREYMDLVAERAVTIGGAARGTIQAAVDQSVLPPFPVEERDEVRLLTELVGRVDALTAELRTAMDGSADEAATQDVYVEVVRGIEKQRWMLVAHLAKR